MPRQIRVTDERNDITTIYLSEIQKNMEVPAEDFIVKPSKDTRIIKA
jgi:outer membrane lipoprotein-sorting protein